MKKLFLALTILFSFYSFAYPQDIKEMFEKSVSTKDTVEKRTLREGIAKNSPDSEYGLFCRAWLLQLTGDNNGAINLYTKAIEINPNFELAYYNRASTYDDFKDYPKAISDYTKAIEVNPKNEWAYYYRGGAYYDLKDYSNAISDYTKVIKLNPKYELAYYYRGGAYFELKDYSKAISDFTKTIELNPKNELAYYYRGRAYYNLKDYSEAISDYTEAIELSPKNVDADFYFDRGNAYLKKTRYYDAKSDFTKAIAIDPNYENAYYNRGLIYDKINEKSKSAKDMEKYEAIKKNKEAIKKIKKAKEAEIILEQFKIIAEQYRSLNPKPEISEEVRKYVIQATALTKNKKYEEALDLYKKIFELDETFSDAHFNAALLLGQMEDYESAVLEMKKYLMLVPDAKDARAAQDKIYEWEINNK